MKHSKRISKFILLLGILFLGHLTVNSQTPFFKLVSVNRSNANIRINSIAQDDKGFIWLGSTNGLYKNNGTGFELYHITDSLDEKDVSTILIDQSGGVLLGYSSGLVINLSKSGANIVLANFKSRITGIIQDSTAYWVATYGEGLYRLQQNPFKIEHFTTKEGIGDNYIYSIVKDHTGRVWVGSDGGLSMSRIQKGIYSFKNLTTENGLPDNIVRNLICGMNGSIVAGTEDKGVFIYNTRLGAVEIPEPMKSWNHGSVTSLIMLEKEYWIGTSNSGIIDYEFDGYRRFRIFNKNNGFAGMNVSSAIRDLEGNIWIAAGSELYLSPGEKIEYKNSANQTDLNNIHAILADSKHRIWFSNDEGFYYYGILSGYADSLLEPLKNTRYKNYKIISMYEDATGHIWLGTFDKGVLRYDPETGYIKDFTEKDGLINGNVLSIAGNKSEIWFATLGGVSKCNILYQPNDSTDFEFTSFSEENGLGNNFIYKVFVDSKGRVWFGTDGMGITVYDHGKFTNYNEKSGLNSRVIYSVAEDKNGNIWLSSVSDGIYRFDGKVFRRFSLAQGLSEINISGLISDGKSNMILVHKHGIDVLDENNFQTITYGEEMGVMNIDPDVNVADCDQDGNVWLGTQKGIIKLNLEAHCADKKPKLILNHVMCFLQPVDTTLEHKFDFDRNHISFDFTGLWYTDPQKLSYQYRLDGYNGEWITTRDRFITYPNLRPGNYVFHLRTSTNGNYAEAPVISYPFTIKFPWWQRAWFIILMLGLFLALLYFYIHFRDKRLKSIERAKKEKLESQFEILKNQVNPHFLFNSFNTLINIIEEDKGNATEYVSKLSDFFRNILAYREKDLIPIDEEVGLVKNYSFLQQQRYGDSFKMNFDIDKEILIKGKIPPLSLQLLVENCLKHNAVSRETPLVIDIYSNNGTLVIRNNINPKMVKESSTGIGLQNLKNRYHLLSGKEIRVTSDNEYFIVVLPII